MAVLVSTNPARNYEKVGSVKVSSTQEVKKKVELANKVRVAWKELGAEQRTKLLEPLYKEFQKREKEIALLTTREIGKPITEALADCEWDRDYFKEFLKNGKEYIKDEITHQEKGVVHKIIYEPIGTAAVIVP